jgi:hypothetical protein
MIQPTPKIGQRLTRYAHFSTNLLFSHLRAQNPGANREPYCSSVLSRLLSSLLIFSRIC